MYGIDEDAGATGTFASANVGTGIEVSVSGVSLAGSLAANYLVTQPTGLTADITAVDRTLAFTQTSYLKSFGY